MGALFSNSFRKLFKKKNLSVLMLGLDAAGKTTIIMRYKLNELVSTIPTIGFNAETIQYNGFSMNIWDIGGQTKIRSLWKHYFHNANALIYVVDSSDVNRLDENRDTLQWLLSEDELRNAALLVFANKQDLPNAASPNEIKERLQLNGINDRPWIVQGTCAKSGEGLYEGLDWLADNVK